MAPKSVFVTGAKSGIGLAFVEKFLQLTDEGGNVEHIFASGRKVNEAKELAELAKKDKRVHLIELDVANDRQIEEAVKQVDKIVGDAGLNLLINNAAVAIQEGSRFPECKRSVINQQLDVNATSVMMMTQAFLPLLKKAADKCKNESMSISRSAVINISSGAGSFHMDWGLAPNTIAVHAYCASKTALNMFTKNLSYDLKEHGILIAAICPGYVSTNMVRGSMDDLKNHQIPVPEMLEEKHAVTPEQSVAEVYSTMRRLREKHTGGYYKRTGEKMENYTFAESADKDE